MFVILLLFTGFPANGQTPQEEYDAFRRQTQKEFGEFLKQNWQEYEDFRKQAQKEFGEFLKQSWQEFELMQGEMFPATPEPVTPQIAEPEIFNEMVMLHVETGRAPSQWQTGQQQTMPVETRHATSLQQQTRHATSLQQQTGHAPSLQPNDNNVSVLFFGSSLTLPFDRKFAIKLRSTKETDVGDFWIKLADADFLHLINACKELKDELCLNDWGYYQLIRELAQRIYPARGMDNERTVFTAFVLDETGYDVRMARNVENSQLVLLSVFESKLYDTPSLEVSEKRYYIPEKSNKGNRIASYRPYAKEEKRRIDLKIDRPLKLKDHPGTFEISANVIGKPLKITYNRNAIDFYNTIPVTDLEVYFNSRGSVTVQQSFEEVLKPVIGTMSEKDAASTLLQLMHHAFEYKTDKEQFGFERPFFFEELFSYPYNNCKDRSVLYAYLIRHLVGLQVVGLKYPGHVATAVRFNERVNGHYISIGADPYIICDPTYINAAIGQCMANYVTVKAEPLFIHH